MEKKELTHERITEIQALRVDIKAKIKGKTISKLDTKDKDQLLLACCRILGILDIDSDIKGGIK